MPRDPFAELDEEVSAKYSGRPSHMDTVMAKMKKKKKEGTLTSDDMDSVGMEMMGEDEFKRFKKMPRQKMTKAMLRERAMRDSAYVEPLGR